jgi:hypothetical protein
MSNGLSFSERTHILTQISLFFAVNSVFVPAFVESGFLEETDFGNTAAFESHTRI